MILLDDEYDAGLDLAALEADCQKLLRQVGFAGYSWSITLVDDPAIRAINQTWRGKDEPTDVLSFPLDELDGAPGGPERSLGDVMISVQTASRQAEEHALTLEVEVRVLLVHGLLHLLGYDHLDPESATRMRTAESRLLQEILGDSAPIGLVALGGGVDPG